MVDVHLLDAASMLSPTQAAELRTVAEQTCGQVAQELGLGPADIVICDFPGYAIPELAVGGYAPGPHIAFVAIEPANAEFARWRERMPTCLAHELHHLSRWQGPGYGTTLLDSLVSEGTATLFEAQRFGRTPPYALSDRSPRELWQAALPHLQDVDQHARWFFRSDDLPRWSGYFLGYELARRYCAATGTDAIAAGQVAAESFLDVAW